MRRVMAVLAALGIVAAAAAYFSPSFSAAENTAAATPIYGITLPEGYRDWRLISVAHEDGKLNDLRAVLGNDIAIAAARRGDAIYPDGSIIARLAWDYTPLPESAAAFGQAQVLCRDPSQERRAFMVKDSKKYAATGGWGLRAFQTTASRATSNFTKPAPPATGGRRADFVFNRYAP